jgi:5-methylcytosine-specific restriction protein A
VSHLTICRGCNKHLIPIGGDGLCHDCKRSYQAREATRTRGRLETEPWRAIYRDPRWAVAKAKALARDRHRCVDCLQPTNQVDHVLPLREGGAPFDLQNLASRCPSCHGLADSRRRRRAKTERPGLLSPGSLGQ